MGDPVNLKTRIKFDRYFLYLFHSVYFIKMPAKSDIEMNAQVKQTENAIE